MFAVTQVEKERRHYVKAVRNLLAETFDLTDEEMKRHDAVWKEWASLNSNYRKINLRSLWAENISEAFKARILTIFLLPCLKMNPFEGGERSSENYLSIHESKCFCWDTLSEKLLRFAVELLRLNAKIEAWHYRFHILEALRLLDEKDGLAKELSDLFSVDDLAYMDPHTALESAFDSKIPEVWKWAIDQKARGIVLKEQEDRGNGNDKQCYALVNYFRLIEFGLYQNRFPYSTDLLASQIEFVIGLPNLRGQWLFSSSLVLSVLSVLSDPKHDSLIHRLARGLICEDLGWGDFSVYCTDGRETARIIKSKFGDEDPELAEKIDCLFEELGKTLSEIETKNKKALAESELKERQIEAVLVKMR